MTSRENKPVQTDPQLDVNILIGIVGGVAEFVGYAKANQPAGLSYNHATCAEFLANGLGTQAQLQALERQYAILLIQDVSLAEIDLAAAKLRSAFDNDSWNRTLRDGDARVAATAYLKGETLATNDLKFFKRARDLGLAVEYVGTGQAGSKAANYQPRPVTIP